MALIRFNTIGFKIAACIALVGVMAVTVATYVSVSAKRIDEQVVALTTAGQRVVYGERLGALVNGVVMESRGIYMSPTLGEAERYIDRLDGRLNEITALIRAWELSLPLEEQRIFSVLRGRVEGFTAFRRLLIETARTESTAAARLLGDDEMSRALRLAMQADIEAFARRDAERLEQGIRGVSTNTAALRSDLLAASTLGALLAALTAMLFAQRWIAVPISNLAAGMAQLAAGNTSITTGRYRMQGGEIGAMCRALTILVAAVKRNNELVAELQARDDREKLLRRDAAVKERAAALDEAMGAVTGRLSDTSRALRVAAEALMGSARQAKDGAIIITNASVNSADKVQSLAHATDELSRSIAEVGGRALDSANIVRGAVADAEATSGAVEQLSATVDRIGAIVHIIGQIAEQTNLLALNATIEAARAGEAGRGFAVVASEVKALATQTARATQDISAQIGGVQDATRRSIKVIETIRGRIAEIDHIAVSIASAVEEQSASTHLIASNVRAAAEGAATASATVSTIGDATGDTSANAEQVAKLARTLDEDAATLRREMDAFFASLRAA